jgi:hypothetical protein
MAFHAFHTPAFPWLVFGVTGFWGRDIAIGMDEKIDTEAALNVGEATLHDSDRKAVIEKWMLTIVQDGGVERYDDLHVDVIDGAWKPKQAWVQAGLIAFQLAVELRNRHQLDFTVALGISLPGSRELIGMDFGSIDELVVKLDSTPPSLYLFNRGQRASFC